MPSFINKIRRLLSGLSPFREKIKVKGELELVVFDKYGNVKDRRHIKNVITDVGKAQVAGLINGAVTTQFKYIAIGTGTTAASSSDTALETETHRELADTLDRVTTTVTNDTARLIKTFSGYTGSESITESGVFDASTGGNMLCRRTFSALNIDWDAGDSLQITWKIQVT
ncbi:MAG: hypothetical protein J7J44_04865 [Deltaproteobacteria bacterium]|nr:hypothetical protein [Deltaproteobacteria bacterium]